MLRERAEHHGAAAANPRRPPTRERGNPSSLRGLGCKACFLAEADPARQLAPPGSKPHRVDSPSRYAAGNEGRQRRGRSLRVAASLHAHAAASTQAFVRVDWLERSTGSIVPACPPDETAVNAANVEGFRPGLQELGYVEGKTFVIEYRSSDGRDERYPGLATELVRLKVDVIVTRGTPAALAAKQATATIPVVITGTGDPVGQGIVASLARPGGNVTGLSAQVTDMYEKRVQIFKELIPRAVPSRGALQHEQPRHPTGVERGRDVAAIPWDAAAASRCAKARRSGARDR